MLNFKESFKVVLPLDGVRTQFIVYDNEKTYEITTETKLLSDVYDYVENLWKNNPGIYLMELCIGKLGGGFSIIYSINCIPTRHWRLVNKIDEKYKNGHYGLLIRTYNDKYEI